MSEIERKFIIKGPVPEGLPAVSIRQGYLTAVTDSVEVRLRQSGNEYFLTVKSGGGLIREEREIAIDAPRFETLWPATVGRRVEKTRHVGQLPGGLQFELDVFSRHLSPLVLVEVEFPTEAQARAFLPPAWFGPEVTEDARFRNKALAHATPWDVGT